MLGGQKWGGALKTLGGAIRSDAWRNCLVVRSVDARSSFVVASVGVASVGASVGAVVDGDG